jgi:hypothetical protein
VTPPRGRLKRSDSRDPRSSARRLHLHLHGVTDEDIAALLDLQEPPRDQM